MSLLYRKTSKIFRRAGVALVTVAGGLSTASAAETYVQPMVDVRTQGHTNYALSTLEEEQTEEFGVIGDLSAIFGWVSPTGETLLRPRLRFQEFTTEERVTNLEMFLDLRSEYKGERSNFLLVGGYEKQDSTTAEYANAGFDDLDPEDPTTPETGSRTFDETRELLELRPSYSYKFSERGTVGFGLAYQNVTYSNQSPNIRADYDYVEGGVSLSWATDPRTDIGVFSDFSRFETKDGLNSTDAVAAGLSLRRQWSEQSTTELRIYSERNEITFGEVPSEITDDSLGAEVTHLTQGETDSWRVVIGSFYTPSGQGSKVRADQLRAEYKRRLSELSTLRVAVRYIDYTSVGDVDQFNDREYVRADLEYRRMLSPTLYVGGGYVFRWQDRATVPIPSRDHQVFLSFGYKGLGKQAR